MFFFVRLKFIAGKSKVRTGKVLFLGGNSRFVVVGILSVDRYVSFEFAVVLACLFYGDFVR